MIIKSDWHIHSEASYDASLTLEKIYGNAKKYGFEKVGITDHVNFNDEKFTADFKNSCETVKKFQKEHKDIILGVELTPIEKPLYDYIKKQVRKKALSLLIRMSFFLLSFLLQRKSLYPAECATV